MWDLKVLSNFLILIALLIAMYVWYFIMYQELKSRGESIDPIKLKPNKGPKKKKIRTKPLKLT